jgi:hypothetical protein
MVFKMMMTVERGRKGQLVSVNLGTKSVYLSSFCFTNLLCLYSVLMTQRVIYHPLVVGPSPVGTPTGGTPVKKKKKGRFRRTKKVNEVRDHINKNTNGDTFPNASDSLKRVINVKNCPLCHRPQLNSKAEIDIITYLVVCASQDWKKVDRIVVGNFVTPSQAQRKWYTRMLSIISSDDYKLGAVRFFLFSFLCR